MTSRVATARAEAGYSLPAFERLAPAPSATLLAARIEAHTGPGDIVVDLAGRGGWVARAALDRQRRAVSIESTPLTRMLAEVVLRPPDVRHLDAAFQGMSASPRRETSLKVSIGDLFATRCATCGRMLIADEFTWSAEEDGPAQAVTRHYRCTVCRDQRGGSEQREAPLEPDDVARSMADADLEAARAWAIERFPVVEGAPTLVDELLELHTPRQLIALTAIMERIETDLRAANVLAALRLSLLHALLPSSRLVGAAGRGGSLRVAGGHVRLPAATQWRERNPWLAFEDAFRAVRGFVQRLEGGALGPMQARLGEDLRSLGEGSATAVLAIASPSAVRALSDGSLALHDRAGAPAPRVRLVLGQPPIRPSLERLAAAYHGTAWTLGREAAAMLPIDALADTSLRAPWSWQAVAIGRSLAAVEPSMARDGRVVQLVDGGMEALAAVAIGGASAGYRVTVARLSDPDDAGAGVIELVPPGAAAAARAAHERQCRIARDPGRCRGPGHGPGSRVVRPAGAVRPASVLAGRGRDRGHGIGGRDPASPGRAGSHGAPVRRGPRGPGPVRPAPPPRRGHPSRRDRSLRRQTVGRPSGAGRHGRARPGHARPRPAVGRAAGRRDGLAGSDPQAESAVERRRPRSRRPSPRRDPR